MVTLLPSEASRQIAIYAAEVSTSLSIDAPPDAFEDQTFQVTGKLTRDDTEEGIANQPIDLYSGPSLLATAQTSATGWYTFNVSIATPGTYTLKAEFDGADVEGYIKRLNGSSARMTIGNPNLDALKPYIIPAAIVAATIYLINKV